MKNAEKEWILELMKQVVKDTDKDFKDQTKSHAFIIGRLEGTIKACIDLLEG